MLNQAGQISEGTNVLEEKLFYLIDFANEEMDDGDLYTASIVLRDIQEMYGVLGYTFEREIKVNSVFFRHMELSESLD